MHKILSHWLSDLDSFDRGWFVHYAKKKKKNHNTTQNKKTKQRKREKRSNFHINEKFSLQGGIPVFYELTSIHRNSFVYFEK